MRERVLTALDVGRYGSHHSADYLARATGAGDALGILLELQADGLADVDGEGGWFVTPAGEAARPYSGVWVDGELWETHEKDGMSTMSVALADALKEA